MGDGQLVVARHSHREFLKLVRASKIVGFQRVENLFQIGKLAVGLVGVVGQAADAHNAADAHVLHCPKLVRLKQLAGFIECQAELCLFGANGNVTCLAFLMEENRNLLMNNNLFLRMIAKASSIILDVVTKRDAIPTSLKERILAYMNYKCPDKILKGVEKAAFQLHCSPRQLQRVLNELTDSGATEKIGKGAYRLRLN